MENPRGRGEWGKAMALLATVALEIVSATLAGIGLGYALWKLLGLPLAFTAVTAVLGFSVGLYRLSVGLRRKSDSD